MSATPNGAQGTDGGKQYPFGPNIIVETVEIRRLSEHNRSDNAGSLATGMKRSYIMARRDDLGPASPRPCTMMRDIHPEEQMDQRCESHGSTSASSLASKLSFGDHYDYERYYVADADCCAPPKKKRKKPTLVCCPAKTVKCFYELEAETLGGCCKSFRDYQGKVVLVVNVATMAENTKSELSELNSMVEEICGDNFVLVAFPSNTFGDEPAENKDMLNMMSCVSPGNGFKPKFEVFKKTDVNGEDESSVFRFLKKKLPVPQDCALWLAGGSNEIRWKPVLRTDITGNFEKFIINHRGVPCYRYTSKKPIKEIKAALKEMALDAACEDRLQRKKCCPPPPCCTPPPPPCPPPPCPPPPPPCPEPKSKCCRVAYDDGGFESSKLSSHEVARYGRHEASGRRQSWAEAAKPAKRKLLDPVEDYPRHRYFDDSVDSDEVSRCLCGRQLHDAIPRRGHRADFSGRQQTKRTSGQALDTALRSSCRTVNEASRHRRRSNKHSRRNRRQNDDESHRDHAFATAK